MQRNKRSLPSAPDAELREVFGSPIAVFIGFLPLKEHTEGVFGPSDMFERLFEKDADGVLKGMTLEWVCPSCAGTNFRLLSAMDRLKGEYHDHCRYCRTRERVRFAPPAAVVEGEESFYERLSDEHFNESEQRELIRDFAEIEYMRADKANPREVAGKQRMLEEKILFFKRRRRM